MSKESENPASLNFSSIVQELEDLVKLTLECEKKELAPNVKFVQVHNQIKALKEIFDGLHNAYTAALDSLSIPESEINKMRQDASHLSENDKKLLQRMTTLQQQCEEAREKIYVSLKENSATVKELENSVKSNSKKKRHRKGKFKGVGGNKNWMPS